MDNIITFFTSAAKLIVAVGLAYVAALWFALIVWTYRDIETRSRSVVTQIFATLLVVLFFIPGAILYYVLRPRDTLDEAFQRSLEEEYLLQDLEDLPRCHKCHRAIESDWVVCPSCHTELRHECPNCSHLVRVTWDICPYCATELEPAAPHDDESSSIGRLTAMIRDRFGDHMGSEARPGEPVFPGSLPQGAPAQLPTYTQQAPVSPQYAQRPPDGGYANSGNNGMVSTGFPDGKGPASPAPFSSGDNAPRTELFPVADSRASASTSTSVNPYNADVPLDFEELPPLYVGAPRSNGNSSNGVMNGNDNGHSNGAMNGNGNAKNGNANSSSRNGGHFVNGPAPNGHIAGTNGSNGFHANGSGVGSASPVTGSGATGFGPLPSVPPGNERGTRKGEPVEPARRS